MQRRSRNRYHRVPGEICEHGLAEPVFCERRHQREEDEQTAQILHKTDGLRREAVTAPDVAEQPTQEIEQYREKDHVHEHKRQPMVLEDLDQPARLFDEQSHAAAQRRDGEIGIAVCRTQDHRAGLAQQIDGHRTEMRARRQLRIDQDRQGDGGRASAASTTRTVKIQRNILGRALLTEAINSASKDPTDYRYMIIDKQ